MTLNRIVRLVVLFVVVFTVVFVAIGVAVHSRREHANSGASNTVQWLRTAGNFDETPDEIACMDNAMHDLLSKDEIYTWLAQDPESITVEEIQALPHAIDVADRCR